MMPSFYRQLVHQLQCQGAMSEQGARELADAAISEAAVEDYPGQLAMLTGLVTTIRVTTAYGDLADVRKLLAEYESDDRDARAEMRGRPHGRRYPVDHAATAAFLKGRPGEWHPVGYYRNVYTATSTASFIRRGGQGAGVHYRPARTFDARLQHAAGGAVVEARYVGGGGR